MGMCLILEKEDIERLGRWLKEIEWNAHSMMDLDMNERKYENFNDCVRLSSKQILSSINNISSIIK